MALALQRTSTIDEAIGSALATLSRRTANGVIGQPGVQRGR